jgi:hypothetical protein
VPTAHTRRSSTDQQLTTRAAELGFASLRTYLADRAIQQQRACWAAKRQARLAELGFADVEDYLRGRRVEQAGRCGAGSPSCRWVPRG